jgi:hypothetical protein
MWYGIINVVPLYGQAYTFWWFLHSFIALFLGSNILINYISCILIDAGSTGSPAYFQLITEARALGHLPSDPQDDEGYLTGETTTTAGRRTMAKKDTKDNTNIATATIVKETDDKLNNRGGAKVTKVTRNPSRRGTGWLDVGPYDWTWCYKTKQPKPPRCHYDSVSKKQILNMDHFCPWMFRAVGYFNYRYFWLFLFWVWCGCLYCLAMTILPFLSMTR